MVPWTPTTAWVSRLFRMRSHLDSTWLFTNWVCLTANGPCSWHIHARTFSILISHLSLKLKWTSLLSGVPAATPGCCVCKHSGFYGAPIDMASFPCSPVCKKLNTHHFYFALSTVTCMHDAGVSHCSGCVWCSKLRHVSRVCSLSLFTLGRAFPYPHGCYTMATMWAPHTHTLWPSALSRCLDPPCHYYTSLNFQCSV